LAANGGHTRAQYRLGQAYIVGRGVDAQPAWGMRWIGKAADAGHPDALFAMGVARSEGVGMPSDRDFAWIWMRRAELAGRPDATVIRRGIGDRIPTLQWHRVAKLVVMGVGETDADMEADSLYDAPTVRFVQFALRRLGFRPGQVDGVKGARTARTIARYRRDNDLPEDDAITPALLDRLRDALYGPDGVETRPAATS